METLEPRLALTAFPLSLSLAEVMSAADAAVQRWREAGVSEPQAEVLSQITYDVRDLSGSKLARTDGLAISIDDDAASHLWFVDQTPHDDAEFSLQPSNAFRAAPGSLAAGKMDLLTVVMHEQGHVLGLAGVVDDSGNVMNEALQAGLRRLPEGGQALHAVAGATTNTQFLTSDAVGGGQPVSTIQPYTALNYAIALTGTFPSENLSFNPQLGTVELFAGNFAPRGYALAQGQLLPVAQNEALFSILGTTYGGDGETTFALPDLRGRVPIGAGQAPRLPNYKLGETGGRELLSISVDNLPPHSHTVPNSPDTSVVGSGWPVSTEQPFLALNAVIALQGIYPSRALSEFDVLGSVDWFAGNFAPSGYAFAHGQLLPISQHQALFSILGTTYGGDGESTFALPDLRGRTPIHAGNGPGLTSVRLGQQGGALAFGIREAQMPAHQHGIVGSADATGITGGAEPIDTRQPFLGLNFNVALTGAAPTRNLDSSEPVTDGQPRILSGDELLDETDARDAIQSLVHAGIDYWRDAGIDEVQIAALESAVIDLADLGPGRLASAEGGVITLDRDAAGRGWFIDDTPEDSVEFSAVDPRTGEWLATDAPAAVQFDLLTTILHEQGHLLGLAHTDAPGAVMYGGLQVGSRKLPQPRDLMGPTEASTDEEFLEAEGLLASVEMFAGNFAPRDWVQTNGALLNIATYSTLFSYLGTTFGGDGRTTFGLPDLRGRVVVGAGGAAGGRSGYPLGRQGGTERVVLTLDNLPSHTHEVDSVEPKLVPTEISIRGSAWNVSSHPLQDNATLPWSNLDTIEVTYALPPNHEPTLELLMPFFRITLPTVSSWSPGQRVARFQAPLNLPNSHYRVIVDGAGVDSAIDFSVLVGDVSPDAANQVSFVDLGGFAAQFGWTGTEPNRADLDGSGAVSFLDFGMLAQAWGTDLDVFNQPMAASAITAHAWARLSARAYVDSLEEVFGALGEDENLSD